MQPRTKSDELAIEQGCYYDPKPAAKVKKFLQTYCVQSKAPWAGQPLKLLPWQLDFINQLYGWHNKDGTRRFKRASIWIPKKNGKSTLMSGLCLWHLLEQKGSEVYAIASDVAQSGIVYGESANMVELSPVLDKRLWTRRSNKSIEDKKNKSLFRILSSEKTGKAGFNANFICYDELAIWGSHARDVWDQLANACIARRNGLQIIISTAQYDKTHIGYGQYDYAKKVKEGHITDTTVLPVIYEVSEDADWRDPEQWWEANPSVEITIPKQSFIDDYKTVENNPLEEARFRTLRLNQWVGHSQQWIASNVWAECKEDFTEKQFEGMDAYVGIDMARRHDLASYVIAIPLDQKVYLLPRFFMPRENALKKQQKDKVPYTRWEQMGLITLTSGDVIDPAAIRASLLEDVSKFNLLEVRYDPYAFEETRQILEYEHGLPMVEVRQTVAIMSPPTAHLERLVLDKKLKHNGHPILTWCLGNCTTRTDNEDRIMIDKQRCTARIDGVTASIIALSGVMAEELDGGLEVFLM